jgi:hypothetical protein
MPNGILGPVCKKYATNMACLAALIWKYSTNTMCLNALTWQDLF